jgi:hypothetical protein
MVHENNKNIWELFLSDNMYQINIYIGGIPGTMCKKLDSNRIQYSNTPVLQPSGTWNKED